jgi:hypothetical protein
MDPRLPTPHMHTQQHRQQAAWSHARMHAAPGGAVTHTAASSILLKHTVTHGDSRTTNNLSRGLLRAEFGGLRCMQNSAEMRKQTIYTGSGPNERVIVLHPARRDAFALDLYD